MANNQLQWRCRRGLLELDILLQRFLRQHYEELAPRQQAAFVSLVELQDLDLWHLVTAVEPVNDDPERMHVLGMLRHTLREDIGNDAQQGRGH